MNLLLLSGSLGLNSISLGHVSIDPSFHGDQDDVSWTTALLRRFLVGGCPRLTACRPNWMLLPPPPLQIILWPPPLLHPHQVQRLQFNCTVVDWKCFIFYSRIFPRRRARDSVQGRKESFWTGQGTTLVFSCCDSQGECLRVDRVRFNHRTPLRRPFSSLAQPLSLDNANPQTEGQ